MRKFNLRNLVVVTVYTVLVAMLFVSCGADNDKYNGMILTDENTGKRYLLKHHMIDAYFIDEEVEKIIGNDTIRVFE